MSGNKVENLAWIIFTIVGTVFVAIGIILFGSVFDYTNKIETTGIITRISLSGSSENDSNKVYVSYVAEGNEYESTLSGYSSSFYEGKEIEIYYDKDDPNKIGMKSLDLLFLIVPGIGLVFLIIGGTGIFIKINRRNLGKRLKENGELIYADYVETIINTSYSVNGRYPYKIICEWTNPVDSEEYTFKSKNIWSNPEDIVEERNIKQFPVYIDKNNKKKYFVDIDILTENGADLR